MLKVNHFLSFYSRHCFANYQDRHFLLILLVGGDKEKREAPPPARASPPPRGRRGDPCARKYRISTWSTGRWESGADRRLRGGSRPARTWFRYALPYLASLIFESSIPERGASTRRMLPTRQRARSRILQRAVSRGRDAHLTETFNGTRIPGRCDRNKRRARSRNPAPPPRWWSPLGTYGRTRR